MTNQPQASVPNKANTNGSHEKLTTKPGTNLVTMAGVDPDCMAIQVTHKNPAKAVKKNRVNQSINADNRRPKVGNANAAKVANAGSASNKARSDVRVSIMVNIEALQNHIGNAT